MKRVIAAGCLFAAFFLTACGAGPAGGSQTNVTPAPVETAAPVTAEPSAAPDNTAAQEVEPAPAETVTAEPVPKEPAAAEISPAEPAPDNGAQSVQDQGQQTASQSFTGVQGTEFIIPEGFIQLDESPSIGYQYTFWHPDHEIRIVVYEIAPGSIPEGAYETDCSIAERNPDVTYFNKGENWFVQSGYNNNGEEVFYSKEASTESGLKTFWITYPTVKRQFGDPITAEFEKNCRF